jgi:hypothetical protein
VVTYIGVKKASNDNRGSVTSEALTILLSPLNYKTGMPLNQLNSSLLEQPFDRLNIDAKGF